MFRLFYGIILSAVQDKPQINDHTFQQKLEDNFENDSFKSLGIEEIINLNMIFFLASEDCNTSIQSRKINPNSDIL